jgi:hypothetical protein
MKVREAVTLQSEKIDAERDATVVDADDRGGIHERRRPVPAQRHTRIAHQRAPAAEWGRAIIGLGLCHARPAQHKSQPRTLDQKRMHPRVLLRFSPDPLRRNSTAPCGPRVPTNGERYAKAAHPCSAEWCFLPSPVPPPIRVLEDRGGAARAQAFGRARTEGWATHLTPPALGPSRCPR